MWCIIVLLLVLCLFSGVSPSQAQSGMGETRSEAAEHYYQNGEYYFVRNCFSQAVGEYNQAIAKDSDYGFAYGNRAAARFNCGDYRGALDDLAIAKGICGSLYPLDSLKNSISQQIKTVPQGQAIAQKSVSMLRPSAYVSLPFVEQSQKPFTIVRTTQSGSIIRSAHQPGAPTAAAEERKHQQMHRPQQGLPQSEEIKIISPALK